MRKITYLLGLVVAFGLLAQDKKAIKYAKTIVAKDLKSHLSILASDAYEGRETGKKGQKMAAKYIANHFKSLGLEAPVEGSFFQPVVLTESTIGNLYFKRGENKKIGFEDFIYYSKAETRGEEYIRLVMVTKESDMKMFDGAYLVLATPQLGDNEAFIQTAKEAGAKGFCLILEDEEEFNSTKARFGPYLKKPSLQLNERDEETTKLILGNKEIASWFFEKSFEEIKEGDATTVIFNADYLDQPVESENVLGLLKGTEKPEEFIVITSHYDHVGIIDGEIHNGADDDGSGTVSVLEIAEAFATAAKKGKGPKRSVLFMTVTGEEKGLLGSQYYTDIQPIFPLANTVANLNIDMIGRVDEAHEANSDYIYLIGSDKLSTELHELSEEINETYINLTLDYTYNDENDPNRFYYRSDHYNFAKNNIPIIFYFNGVHPDYHKPTDTIEKIQFKTMQKRARLVFHTAWEIAQREERIQVDKGN